MNADDLAPFLASTPAADRALPELGIHIGQVLAWESATGQNTVSVAGSPLTDLPMLNIGDTTNLAVGDTVVVLRTKSAYFILGRVAVPGSGVFATSAVSFHAIGGVGIANIAIGTSEATYATYTVPVPAWANRVLFSVTHDLVAAHTSTTVRRLIYSSSRVPALGYFADQTAGLLLEAGGPGPSPTIATISSVLTGNIGVTPGSSFDIEGRGMCHASSIPAHAGSSSRLNGFAIFTKT